MTKQKTETLTKSEKLEIQVQDLRNSVYELQRAVSELSEGKIFNPSIAKIIQPEESFPYVVLYLRYSPGLNEIVEDEASFKTEKEAKKFVKNNT